MTILGKKQMSEEDIKLNYITPVILDGWKGHVTMETKITDGRINISGNIVARSKPKFADYILYLNDGKPIAVVEAKDNYVFKKLEIFEAYPRLDGDVEKHKQDMAEYEERHKGVPLLTPPLVANGTLAAELALKYLVFKEKGEYERSHQLQFLFAPVRSFLNGFAYGIYLRVLAFFSLFR